MVFLSISNFFIYKAKDTGAGDQLLLEKYRATGNLQILGMLFNRYMHLVYGVCLKYLQDREESKDAVMNVFEKLMTEIPNHDIRNFKSWLHVLTKNYCLMQLRTSQAAMRNIGLYVENQENFVENDFPLHHDNEQRIDDDLDKLRECIGELREHQRDCVILFYLEDKPYREIVDLLDLDIKKVKSYIQNARRNLKICIENKHE